MTVHSVEDRQPVPLALHHVPICISFGFFGDGKMFVVDPTRKEELAMSGSLTVTMNIHKEICGIQKAGGVTVEANTVSLFRFVLFGFFFFLILLFVILFFF